MPATTHSLAIQTPQYSRGPYLFIATVNIVGDDRTGSLEDTIVVATAALPLRVMRGLQ